MNNTIYKYQPVVISGPNGTVFEPKINSQNDDGNNIIYLCEIDGWKYVSVPENENIDIPEEITTWQNVEEIDDELKEKIRSKSNYLKMIDDEVQAKIRSLYRLDQELYISRISVGHLMGNYTPTEKELELIEKYQIDIENIRKWSKNQRKNLGL